MMRVSIYARLVTCLFAGALVLPAGSTAQNSSCASGTPTAQSYTWNFRQEAQGLLDNVGAEAWRTSFHADQLQHFSNEIAWEEHADELNAIRAEVNNMGSQLCRQEAIRRVVSPWEQKAIDDAAPLITEMSREVQSAIAFLNDNQDHLFNPTYHAYSKEMFQQSSRLAHQVSEFEDFAKVHQEDIRLEKSLGLIKRS
jgi:hypothetical protein